MIARRLVSALVDGEEVSWRDAARLAESARDRQLVEDLRWIKSVSAARLQTPGEERPAPLPMWASAATWWAVLQIWTGSLALALGWSQPSRFAVAQVLLVGSFLFASLLLFFGGRRDIRARWLALVYALTAASFAHAFLPTGTVWITSLFSAVPVEALIPAAVWRFAQVFPKTARFSSFDRVVGVVAGLTLATGAALIAINLAIHLSPAVARSPLALLGRANGSWQFWALLYPLLLPGLLAPLVRAFAAPVAERQRVSLFTITLAGGMAPILVSGLIEEFAPDLAGWWTASPSARAVVDATVLGALLLVPPATTYAILTRQALTLRLVIERVTRYALARSSLAVLVTIPAMLLGWFFFLYRDQPISVVVSGGRGRVIAIWLAIATVLLVARRPLLRLVDRAFHSGDVDHAAALAGAIAALRGTAGVTPIVGLLAGQIRHVFGSAAAVLRMDARGDGQPMYGKVLPIPAESAILAIARGGHEPIVFHGAGSILELLPEADRGWVIDNAVEVVLPLNRAEGTTLALLAVGAKRDRFPWSKRDLSWLRALGDAAALALDNAFRETDTGRTSGKPWHASECRACGAVRAESASACGCGGDMQPALLPALLHDKFAVERCIGRGGMGVVYQGLDLALHRGVALKTLPYLDPESSARMRSEARAMGALSHPNIATIFGVEVWQRTPVLVMELLDGGTLADRLRGRVPVPVAEAIAICATIARALSALHRAGLIHGDIKPSNIGFAAGGTPKLLDFGLTTLIRAADSHDPALLAGTPQYLPPEAWDGAPATAAFDLWALSVVLFETLAGANPFAAEDFTEIKRRVRTTEPPDVRAWRDVPTPMAEMLTQCLHPRPELRPADAADWLNLVTNSDPHMTGRSA